MLLLRAQHVYQARRCTRTEVDSGFAHAINIIHDSLCEILTFGVIIIPGASCYWGSCLIRRTRWG